MASIQVKKDSLAVKIVDGALAGLIGVTCVFPIDLCKTRLQNQQPGPNGELMYKSMWDCFKKTWKTEKGLRGIYSGSLVNLILITPEKVIKLVGNDVLRGFAGEKNGELVWYKALLAGGGAGMCQIIVTTPMELLKIQLQDAGRSAKIDASSGAATVAKPSALALFKQLGLKGIYKGFCVTAFRDVTFSAIYFPCFAELNRWILRKLEFENRDFRVTLFSGICCGAMGSFAVTPIDVVKTRLQTIHKGKGEEAYKGIADCFVKIYKHEGMLAFFKGGLCRMMVIAPLFGIAQMVYFLGIGDKLVQYGVQATDYVTGKQKQQKWD